VTSYTLRIPTAARPLTENQDKRLHHMQVAKLRAQYRNDACWLAHDAGIPPLGAVHVTARAVYLKGALTDPGACAPTVKGCIDGLVDARVMPDDTGQYVHSITYLPAVKGDFQGIELTVVGADVTVSVLDNGEVAG
jgi:crossover junction endodeoxyribonuclease RusA